MHEENWLLLEDLLEKGQTQEAEVLLRFAIRQEPMDGRLFALRALCLNNAGQVEKAVEAVCEGLRRDPDCAFTHWVHGALLHGMGRWGSALAEAGLALKLDRADPANYALLSHVHASRGDLDRAMDVAEEGLRLDPTDPACHEIWTFVRQMRRTARGADSDPGATIEPTWSVPIRRRMPPSGNGEDNGGAGAEEPALFTPARWSGPRPTFWVRPGLRLLDTSRWTAEPPGNSSTGVLALVLVSLVALVALFWLGTG